MKHRTDFTNIKCYKCGKGNLTSKTARRLYSETGNWTGRWLCKGCWFKYDYNKRAESHSNIMKSLADRRTGNLDLNSPCGKGDTFQKLTCIWLEVRDLNIERDNYNYPIDHSIHPVFGILQTKGKLYDHINGVWKTY